MILDIERHPRENGGEFIAELRKSKFMRVKWVRSSFGTRFCIVALVGCRNQKLPLGRKHAAYFVQKRSPIVQMFDDFESDHQVKITAGRWDIEARCAFKPDAWVLEMPSRVFNRLLRNINAQNLACFAGQFGRTISRTAAG